MNPSSHLPVFLSFFIFLRFLCFPHPVFAGVPYATGDIFTGTNHGKIYHYSGIGLLKNTLHTGASSAIVQGLCFDHNGHLRAANTTGTMSLFNNQGEIIEYPWGGPFHGSPTSCVADEKNGIVYIYTSEGVGYFTTKMIRKFTNDGTEVATYEPDYPTDTGTIFTNGLVSMDLAPDNCTMLYTTIPSINAIEGIVKSFNVCTNTQNPDFAVNLPKKGCTDVRIRENGEVLIACNTQIYKLSSAGEILATYQPKDSINLPESQVLYTLRFDPTETYLFAGGTWSGNMYKIDFATGEGTEEPIFTVPPADPVWNTITALGVYEGTPTPTPSQSPTPIASPTPEPFLELPWEYEGKMSFNDAALTINSYFDHAFPLLSSGLAEPSNERDTVISYLGSLGEEHKFDFQYSSHDGYDYGLPAKVDFGDTVIAAADGLATYHYSNAGGNMIYIDHGNYYQTRYLHMQKDGLITYNSTVPKKVHIGESIGKVGTEGNCRPKEYPGDKRCAHIHFGVFQDKNHDGNFEDNVPDGVTDPFGWQSEDPDPWENYSFFYNGKQRTGNKSFYLWKKKIDGLREDLPTNGGVFTVGKYQIKFPHDDTRQPLHLTIQSSPIVNPSATLRSLGPTIFIQAKDMLNNLVRLFTEQITVSMDFTGIDLSLYKRSTMSIYSSDDGHIWTKEETMIDMTNKKATTRVNHLTYFALMAERIDIIAPTTTVELQGKEGQLNWFRSNVQVVLTAKDNEGGLGVNYTLYKIEDEDWQKYTTPFLFTTEGKHTISFYSTDKDDNIEAVQTVEIFIDKTSPQIDINADPKTLWPPSGDMVNIAISGSSHDDNLKETVFKVIDEYGLLAPEITDFGQTIQLQAKRHGNDKDGRTYLITGTATDKAGNQNTKTTSVTVPHDKREKQ